MSKISIQHDIINENIIDAITDLFKTMGDPTRLKIINAIAIEGEVSVEALTESLHLSQSAISHSLRRLKSHRVVKVRRQGKYSLYSLDDDHVLDLYQLALDHILEEDHEF